MIIGGFVMKRKLLYLLVCILTIVFMPNIANAADAARPDSGDSSFMFVSTVLVFIMTPGLALFYGGMVRKKMF